MAEVFGHDSVECGACGQHMRLVAGWETPLALKCECGEYFYALHRGMSAIRSCAPKDPARAFALVLPVRGIGAVKPEAKPWLDLKERWQAILDRATPSSTLGRQAREHIDRIDRQLARLDGLPARRKP